MRGMQDFYKGLSFKSDLNKVLLHRQLHFLQRGVCGLSHF